MKLIGLLDLPGTGTGPLRTRSPQARLCIGGLLLLALIATPLSLPSGVLVLLAVVALSILIGGIPVHLLLRTVLVFGILYMPLLLLLLLSRLLTADGFQLSLIGPSGQIGEIALRSFALLIVATAVVSTLTIADAVRGSAALPIPRLVVTVLFHILHQASLMLRETASIAQAVALRSGARGFKAGLVMVRSLPSVWLPRVEARIERMVRAADLRGADHIAMTSQPSPWRSGDALFILLGCGVPVLAATLRFFH